MEGCKGAAGTDTAPEASGLMDEGDSPDGIPTEFNDGWRGLSELSLGCIQTGIPQNLPRRDTGAVERSRMPVTAQGHPELLGMGTPRAAGACQHGRSGKKRGREGDRWAAMET